jgi:hypothetical protein
MIVLAWVRSSGLAVHTCRAIAAFFFWLMKKQQLPLVWCSGVGQDRIAGDPKASVRKISVRVPIHCHFGMVWGFMESDRIVAAWYFPPTVNVVSVPK